MSLRTRINGLTAWVNLRLRPYDHLMNNVVMDLLAGTNMKMLVQSMTGREMKKLQSFEGLTQQQKITRVEWVLDELKRWKVVPADVFVDSRLFAMRSADHIFHLLWRLVGHDVWFVWERLEFLQHTDDEVLTGVPFKWVPEAPPQKRKSRSKKKQSLLAGFGSSSLITGKIDEDQADGATDGPPEDYEPFPNSGFMKKFKQLQVDKDNYPSSAACILEMVNSQMKTVHEGKKLHCANLDDLVDSRVLCALVNSFVPNTFTTEVLLNDRWTINLVLRTTERMFYMESPVDSEDLVEADPMTVCSYFCVVFMVGFKYRQSCAAIRRREALERAVNELKYELDQFPIITSNQQHLQQRKELRIRVDNLAADLQQVEKIFDLEFCYKWMDHVFACQKEVNRTIHDKIKDRFDTISVPRNITINDLCLALVINLSLSNGSGFYLADGKEVLGEGRKIILKEKASREFFDDFTGKDKDLCRKMLHLPPKVTVDINTKNYQKYQIFLEAPSRNKQLKAGTTFLYQVFPATSATWQKIFQKAVRDNQIESVKRVVAFFRHTTAFINCREPNTGNSPLYNACRMGHFDIALCLLENGADIDQKNSNRQTPLFAACEGLHRNVAHGRDPHLSVPLLKRDVFPLNLASHPERVMFVEGMKSFNQLLIEWGCDVHAKGPRTQTAFETIKNDEFRDFLIGVYDHYSTVVPQIMEGDMELLDQLVTNHRTGVHQLCNLRSRRRSRRKSWRSDSSTCPYVLSSPWSRCINGSTLLHTASYFDCIPVIRDLLKLNLDVNLLDYKGAAPLHRAKGVETMRVLVEAGARPSVEDSEGNTPLHVKCYGETGEPSEMGAVALLLAMGAKLAARNHRGLLPIHCAAMQGRIDIIHLLLQNDRDGEIRSALATELTRSPLSLPHLSLANDFIECAQWLVEAGFDFKDSEVDVLLQRILSEQVKIKDRSEAVHFLLEQGASPSISYPGDNTALHYAASMSGSTDVLEMLIAYGADLDFSNEERATPLFFACQANNQLAASILLSHGANVRSRNAQGLTAFDFIMDYDEWIESGYFTDEIRARLKAYSLKHARDLIRAISKKVKAPQRGWLEGLHAPANTVYSTMSFATPSRFSHHSDQSHVLASHGGFALPPLRH